MVRWTKTLLKAAGALLLVGIVFSLIGSLMGARTIQFEDGQFYVGDQKAGYDFPFDWNRNQGASLGAQKNIPIDGDGIDCIEIDEIIGDFKIVLGNDWELEYQVVHPEKVKCRRSGNTLSIEYQYDFKNRANEQLTLTVPQDARLKEIEIVSAVGDLQLEQLNCKSLSVDSALGNIFMNGVTADDLDISGAMGNVKVTNLVVNRDAEFNVPMGNLEAEGQFGREVEIEHGMGNVSLTVTGAGVEEYDLDIEGGMGEIEVDGLNSSGFGGSYVRETGKDKKITISGGMGEIKVDFE